MTAPSGPAADADVLFEDDDIVVVNKPAGRIVLWSTSGICWL